MNTKIITVSLIVLISVGRLFSQNAVYVSNQNGKVKTYNPITQFLRTQDASLNFRTSPLKVTSSKINTIFEKDSLDLFNPNLYLFATTKSFNALDDGSGRKILYGVKYDTGAGSITSYFYNSSNYSVIGSFSDTLFKKTFYTQSANLPLSDPNKLDFAIHHGGSNAPSLGSPVVKIYNKLNGNKLFNLNYGDNNQTGYFYSNVPTSDSYPQMDLNGNGLNEIISVMPLPFLSGWRLYVYDNFSIIDSIDETRASFFSMFASTCADINGDGISEVITSVNSAPQFFQWNASVKKFQSIGILPPLTSMYLKPENVDGSSSKEIITQGGLLGDSLYIFDNTFNLKYKIKVPGIGIQRYFIQNVNDSPNKELIVVSKIGNPIQFFVNATYIYDLSRGTDPIWMDSTFEAVAVGDFKNDGKNRILGLEHTNTQLPLLKYLVTGTRTDVRMISFSNSTFSSDWTFEDTTITFQNIAGPFTPLDWASVAAISFFGPGSLMNIKNTDLNGDGKNKFVFNVVNDSAKSFYVLVNSDGTVVDTLPGPYKNCYALAADLNNDGHDELLVTQFKPELQFMPDTALQPRAWVFEYGGGTTGIKDNHQVVANYKLEQNYPNPFNPSTTISFQIPIASKVSLKVYDVLGREVETLVNENKPAGKYSINFNADKLASGVYLYRLQAGNYIESKKMILLK